MRAGQFKGLSPPGSYVYVYATGINNFSEVVGWTSDGSAIEGFAYKQGKYQTILFPGAGQTEAHGVNDGGMVVGWYAVGSSDYGFALMKGKYVSFGYPGAVGTFPSAIDVAGRVVGSYTFDCQIFHGFVTSPITSEDFRSSFETTALETPAISEKSASAEAADPSAISSIVDNMLAELKPRLMEEIAKKLAAEKKR